MVNLSNFTFPKEDEFSVIPVYELATAFANAVARRGGSFIKCF
jgi:hypothetical protein